MAQSVFNILKKAMQGGSDGAPSMCLKYSLLISALGLKTERKGINVHDD